MKSPPALLEDLPRLARASSRLGFRACALAVLAVALTLGVLSSASVSLPLLGAAALAWVASLGWLCREHARVLRRASLADHTLSSIFVTDSRLRIGWTNPAFTRLNGRRAETVLGASPRVLLGALSERVRGANERSMQAIEAAVEARLSFRQVLCARRADGSHFFTRLEGAPMPERGGGVSYLWIQSDQQEAEIARRRLEARAMILEAMSSKIELIDVLEEMAAAMVRANDAVRPVILLFDRGAMRVVRVVAPSFSSAFARQFLGKTPADAPQLLRPFLTAQKVTCLALAADAAWAPFQAQLGPDDVLPSGWTVPAFDRDHRVTACIVALSALQREPLADELALMTDVAELLSLALSQRQIESENRTLLGAVQAAEAAVLMVDALGRVQFENDAVPVAFGASALAGAPFAAFVRAHLQPDNLRALLEATAGGTPWRGRLQAHAAEGEARWFEANVTHIAGSDGAHTSALVTFRDVSEFVRSERVRAFSLEGDKAKVAVAWALSVDGPLEDRCGAALASVFQMLGFSPSSRGAIFARASPEEDFRVIAHLGLYSEALLRTAKVRVGYGLAGTLAASGQVVVTDGCLEELDAGERHVCEVGTPHGHYVLPLMERPGYALGMVVLSCDPMPVREAPRLEALALIAELFATAIVRDTAERSLRESTRRADEANRAKSEFLATMSHEIRTPMNGVLGFTQLLLNSELDGEQREYAELIFNSAEALLALLNDILDFSKIEAGKLVLDPRPTAVVATAREAVGLLRPSAERKGVTLTFHADQKVPSGLLIDAMRFRQVLLNLTGNGVKFTHSGEVKVSLSLEEQLGALRLKVAVSDSGIGISSEVLPTLFSKFVQGDGSTSRRFGGTGLGLAISKRLVELMGGTIEVRSVEGQGSTFWFSLPITEAALEAEHHPARLEPHSAVRKRRVLLAEDNLVNQLLAKRVLEKMGAMVTVACNGREAVTLVQGAEFEVILMDCQMPELDGYEATRAIRRLEAERGGARRMPIIAVTANAFADDIERCMSSGMDAVLTKPFRLAELEQALTRLDRPRLALVS